MNPKYSDVQSVVDHGKSFKDVNIISDSLIAKKKGENFGRIRPDTLAKFLSESNNEESVFELMQKQRAEEDKENRCNDTLSVAESMRSHKCESVATTCAGDLLGQSSESTKFILLDMREEVDYRKFHIREAINFPAPNISRDKSFGQLSRFKNHSDKIIVVYMEDERQGT